MKKMTKKKKLFRKVTALAAVIALGGIACRLRLFRWRDDTALFLAAGNGEPGGHGNADLR